MALGVYDLTDISHTCALALFLIQLRQQYKSISTHLSLSRPGSGPGRQIRDFCWRLDHRYPGPEKHDEDSDDDANPISAWCSEIITVDYDER